MKKIISLSLAIILIFCCMFIFTGCVSQDAPGVNEGYKSFNNGDISFDYPETWLNIPFIKEFLGINMIMDLEGSGNNINVNSVARDDSYMDIPDAESFMEQMKPELEAQGLTVENGEIEKGTVNGIDYLIFSFDSEMSEVPMKQSIIFASAGEYTYIITVTLASTNPEIVDAILSTLAPVK